MPGLRSWGRPSSPTTTVAARVPISRHQREEWRSEEERLQARLRENPGEIASYRSLAQLYERQHLWYAAEGVYRQALQRRPDDPTLLTGLAEVLAARGEETEARRYATQSLRLDQQQGAAHLVVAKLHHQAGRLSAAETAYETAWRCQPPPVAAGVALAEFARERGDNQRAADYLRVCVLSAPEDVVARRHYAQVLAEQGQRDRAIAQWETLLAQGQSAADIHVRLAELLEEEGRPGDARRHLAAAGRLEPDDRQLAQLEQRLTRQVARRPTGPAPDYQPLPGAP